MHRSDCMHSFRIFNTLCIASLQRRSLIILPSSASAFTSKQGAETRARPECACPQYHALPAHVQYCRTPRGCPQTINFSITDSNFVFLRLLCPDHRSHAAPLGLGVHRGTGCPYASLDQPSCNRPMRGARVDTRVTALPHLIGKNSTFSGKKMDMASGHVASVHKGYYVYGTHSRAPEISTGRPRCSTAWAPTVCKDAYSRQRTQNLILLMVMSSG